MRVINNSPKAWSYTIQRHCENELGVTVYEKLMTDPANNKDVILDEINTFNALEEKLGYNESVMQCLTQAGYKIVHANGKIVA